uniref:PARP catalytic domain-containing protein n=1 Tax=Cyprinus carpio TaxID=7962 RepID=A0A8C2BEM8_CYPCA
NESEMEFSGWEAYCDKSNHLKPGQEPKKSHEYIMYHGTLKTNASAVISSGFRPSTGETLGPGVYCSRNINKAMCYPPCGSNNRVVLKQNLNLQTSWHQQGCDTASLVGFEEDCVWDPKRITVIGIAHCTDYNTKSSLERHKHTMEKCWSCKTSICPFMKKHVC